MTQNPSGGSQREELERLVAQIDVAKLIETFDADFDVPLAYGTVIGVLYMKRAFEPRPDQDTADLAVTVGAYWCDIVRSDVEFDLRHGLARIDESAADAERLSLTVRAGNGSGDFPAYVAARWSDGAGKILYRIGSHARGRMRFADACALAGMHDLWWCLPDLRSNLLRARLEEARQAVGQGADRPGEVIGELRAERQLCEQVAAGRRIPVDGSGRRRRGTGSSSAGIPTCCTICPTRSRTPIRPGRSRPPSKPRPSPPLLAMDTEKRRPSTTRRWS